MNLSHWLIHTPCPQAVLLCQLLVPVDYELAFSLLSTHSRLDRYSVSAVLLTSHSLRLSLSLSVSLMAESYFTYFWDMVIIEYLICILTRLYNRTTDITCCT